MRDDSRGRARIGALVPFTNTNLEPDLVMMQAPGVSVHVTRLGGYDADEVPDEAQMAGLGSSDIEGALSLLQGARPDVILYGCTSATLAHGPSFDRELAATIREDSGAATVTAAGALVHAARTLGITRIGFASPYVPSLNDSAIAFLRNEGIETVARADVDGRLGNTEQGALTPDAVAALALSAKHEEAEAVVLSCTDMRAVEVIGDLEDQLGKPVITSNQAMLFQAYEHLGITNPPAGFGQLFEQLRSS